MHNAAIFWKLNDIMNFCIDRTPKEGFEFGVAIVTTTNIIATMANYEQYIYLIPLKACRGEIVLVM